MASPRFMLAVEDDDHRQEVQRALVACGNDGDDDGGDSGWIY